MNKLEELLKSIGGRESTIKIPGVKKLGINYGVCQSWCLQDIKGDGVSYNLFKRALNVFNSSSVYWDVYKINETKDEMEFDSFNIDEQGFYDWLEKEFRDIIRDKKINDILN
jgi:hypothetical protein